MSQLTQFKGFGTASKNGAGTQNRQYTTTISTTLSGR